MGVGKSAGGEILRVDPEMLSRLGSELKSSANALPAPPAKFVVSGDDAISQAIKGKLTTLEDPIIENLPKVKTAAVQTAGNIVDAAARYQSTDEDLAAKIEKGLFDGAGSGAGAAGAGGSGGGSAGSGGGGAASAGAGAAGSGSAAGLGSAATASAGAGGDAASQMSQLMSTPMQLASQVAQAPQQVMGALGGAMQGAMQGAQQITQMASSAGKDSKGVEPPADPSAEQRAEEQKKSDEREAEAKREEASGGQHRSERVPDSAVAPAPHKDSAGPVQPPSAPKHAAPDKTYTI